MKIIKTTEIGRAAAEKLLQKAAFDEVSLNPRIQAKNKELYGEDLTPAQIVEKIVTAVRKDGDAAVIKYTKMLDGSELTADKLLVSAEEFEDAYALADPAVVASLRKAIANVRSYHEEQKPRSWMTYREKGSILGQSVVPLDRVGIYVPGGTAS